jgi:hypothetical protein
VNPRQLEQDLELPNIKSSLVAYRDAAQKSKWYIRFFRNCSQQKVGLVENQVADEQMKLS